MGDPGQAGSTCSCRVEGETTGVGASPWPSPPEAQQQQRHQQRRRPSSGKPDRDETRRTREGTEWSTAALDGAEHT
ncbi:hypothetical protein CKAH01_01017 [Colletotrichum kahawae]|uniref:Uncharacterized protein n=1 Tax=Colletotrichum kahawae TaxID=34407 RepID=A0AAD9YKQ0_COLKA|nr:hypothetical protein CKAH01_01017 [Colletotrichum kahawae]